MARPPCSRSFDLPSLAERIGIGSLLIVSLGIGACSRSSQMLEPQAIGSLSTLSRDGTVTTARGSLDALWPNDDGRYWSYRYFSGFCPPAPDVRVYATRVEVPPAPSLQDIFRVLRDRRHTPHAGPGIPTSCFGVLGRFNLRFNGQITTLTGVTAQNLEESFVEEGGQARAQAGGGFPQVFAARLARARPDVAPRLGRLAPIETELLRLPLLIHGYAWEKTPAYIGTYGDFDRDLAWKFLDTDLSPGASFTFQLIPSVVDDAFLHALVLSGSLRRVPRLPAGQIEVAYLIDYGVSESVDSSGNIVGYFRLIDYGTVVYAPGVGPVESFEQVFGSSDAPFQTVGFVHLDLIETGPGTLAPPLAAESVR